MSFRINSLSVIDESLETKKIRKFVTRSLIAESIGLKGGQTSIMDLCNLQSPYKIIGLLQTPLIFYAVWQTGFLIFQVP